MDLDDAPTATPQLLLIAIIIAVLAYMHGPAGAVLAELGFKHLASWATSVSVIGTILGVGAAGCFWLHGYVTRKNEEVTTQRAILHARTEGSTLPVFVVSPPADGR